MRYSNMFDFPTGRRPFYDEKKENDWLAESSSSTYEFDFPLEMERGESFLCMTLGPIKSSVVVVVLR